MNAIDAINSTNATNAIDAVNANCKMDYEGISKLLTGSDYESIIGHLPKSDVEKNPGLTLEIVKMIYDPLRNGYIDPFGSSIEAVCQAYVAFKTGTTLGKDAKEYTKGRGGVLKNDGPGACLTVKHLVEYLDNVEDFNLYVFA